jgi:hypothetical protein
MKEIVGKLKEKDGLLRDEKKRNSELTIRLEEVERENLELREHMNRLLKLKLQIS